MDFVLNLLVIIGAPVIFMGLLCAIGTAYARFMMWRSARASETSVGISPITHAAMHESLKEATGDSNITSEYVPVIHSIDPMVILEACLIRPPLWKRVMVRVVGFCVCFALVYGTCHTIETTYELLRYDSHVAKICTQTGPETYGYDQGVWSNHPDLLGFAKEVSPQLRKERGRKLCGH